MSLQDTGNFWDRLVRTVAGPSGEPIPPVVPVQGEGFLGKALAGWRGAMQNPEARQTIQDLGLVLMGTNTGNPFTDVSKGVFGTRGLREGREAQAQERKDKERNLDLEERRAKAYEAQVEGTIELGKGNQDLRRELDAQKRDTALALQKMKGMQKLQQIDAMARSGAYARGGAGGGFNLDRIMYEGLIADGMDPLTASQTIVEYKMLTRAFAGATYAAPPSPIQQAIAQDVTGAPVPPRNQQTPPADAAAAIQGLRPPSGGGGPVPGGQPAVGGAFQPGQVMPIQGRPFRITSAEKLPNGGVGYRMIQSDPQGNPLPGAQTVLMTEGQLQMMGIGSK